MTDLSYPRPSIQLVPLPRRLDERDVERPGRPAVSVLVVDPDRWSRRVLVGAVAAVPDLRVAHDLEPGPDLGSVCERLAADLVLLSLPQLGAAGLELIGELRALTSPPRIAVLTDDCDYPTVLAARGRGAGGYLVRSDELDLPAALRLVAGGAVLLSPTAAAAAEVMLARALALHPPTLTAPATRLSPRQLTVLQLMADGCSNAEIAGRLHIEVRTVKWHVSKLLELLQLRDRQQLIAHAHNRGLLTQPLDLEDPGS